MGVLLQVTSGDDSTPLAVLGFLFIAAIVVGIAWVLKSLFGKSAKGSRDVTTIRDPDEVADAALHFFTAEGWTTTTADHRAMAFAREVRPSLLACLFLLLLGIIPGLLYIVFGRATMTAAVTVTARNTETLLRVSWNDDTDASTACDDFVRMLEEQEPTPQPVRS